LLARAVDPHATVTLAVDGPAARWVGHRSATLPLRDSERLRGGRLFDRTVAVEAGWAVGSPSLRGLLTALGLAAGTPVALGTFLPAGYRASPGRGA
jgi:hypothetical protein